MQWGDVATWVGAIATAVAAAVAVWLGWRAHQDERERRQEQRQHEIAQARRVFAWGSADGQRGHFSIVVFVLNGTDAPLHGVGVTAVTDPAMKLGVQPIGTTFHVLAPGETRRWETRVPWAGDLANPPLYTMVTFVDRDGLSCQRHPDGSLTVGRIEALRFPKKIGDDLAPA